MTTMRFIAKVAAILTLLFAACIGLIRAQPYDDSKLRAFLISDACSMPCFMGIRPGLTTLEEAATILETHEWVGEMNIITDSLTNESERLLVNWSGSQPELVNSARPGHFSTGGGDFIGWIELASLASLGDIWLALGQPDEVYLLQFTHTTELLARYVDQGLEIAVFIDCAASTHNLWQLKTYLHVYDANLSLFAEDPSQSVGGYWMRELPCLRIRG